MAFETAKHGKIRDRSKLNPAGRLVTCWSEFISRQDSIRLQITGKKGLFVDRAWEFRPLEKQRTKKFAGFDNFRVQSERFRYPTVFSI